MITLRRVLVVALAVEWLGAAFDLAIFVRYVSQAYGYHGAGVVRWGTWLIIVVHITVLIAVAGTAVIVARNGSAPLPRHLFGTIVIALNLLVASFLIGNIVSGDFHTSTEIVTVTSIAAFALAIAVGLWRFLRSHVAETAPTTTG